MLMMATHFNSWGNAFPFAFKRDAIIPLNLRHEHAQAYLTTGACSGVPYAVVVIASRIKTKQCVLVSNNKHVVLIDHPVARVPTCRR